MTESLADQIRAQAVIADRSGQMNALLEIADRVAALEAVQRTPLAYVVLSKFDTAERYGSVWVATSLAAAQDIYDKRRERMAMDPQWFEGMGYVIGEVREVPDA